MAALIGGLAWTALGRAALSSLVLPTMMLIVFPVYFCATQYTIGFATAAKSRLRRVAEAARDRGVHAPIEAVPDHVLMDAELPYDEVWDENARPFLYGLYAGFAGQYAKPTEQIEKEVRACQQAALARIDDALNHGSYSLALRRASRRVDVELFKLAANGIRRLALGPLKELIRLGADITSRVLAVLLLAGGGVATFQLINGGSADLTGPIDAAVGPSAVAGLLVWLAWYARPLVVRIPDQWRRGIVVTYLLQGVVVYAMGASHVFKGYLDWLATQHGWLNPSSRASAIALLIFAAGGFVLACRSLVRTSRSSKPPSERFTSYAGVLFCMWFLALAFWLSTDGALGGDRPSGESLSLVSSFVILAGVLPSLSAWIVSAILAGVEHRRWCHATEGEGIPVKHYLPPSTRALATAVAAVGCLVILIVVSGHFGERTGSVLADVMALGILGVPPWAYIQNRRARRERERVLALRRRGADENRKPTSSSNLWPSPIASSATPSYQTSPGHEGGER